VKVSFLKCLKNIFLETCEFLNCVEKKCFLISSPLTTNENSDFCSFSEKILSFDSGSAGVVFFEM
jgi:hypothetical protein